jgi:hypothetical protein
MSGYVIDQFPSVLGGGIPGGQPKGGLLGGGASTGGRGGSSGMEGGGNRSVNRLILRRVLNHTVFPNGNPQVITPFRRYFNAGDTAGTFNSSPSALLGRPISQTGSSSMVSRINAPRSGVYTGDAFYTGNQKYVYDGADYVRFKKLQATNRNYNDSSNGGENGTTTKQAFGRVRR